MPLSCNSETPWNELGPAARTPRRLEAPTGKPLPKLGSLLCRIRKPCLGNGKPSLHVHEMTMGKFSAFALTLAALIAAPLVAPADPPPYPNHVYRSLESGKAAHDAGVIHGKIENIDYSSGTLVVRSRGGDIVVAVVPSTAIYRGGEFASVGDLRRGENVEISVFEVGGGLVAQMIRLK